LQGEMRRIARFLDIEVPEQKWPMLAEAATFAAMKRDAAVLGPEMDMIFEGGANRLLYKGTNDRWRDVLTSDDVALYEAAAARAPPRVQFVSLRTRRMCIRSTASRVEALSS